MNTHPTPADGWDCHVHVFDPTHPAQAGHYQPVLRDLPEIEQTATALGMGHLVLVQPSVYGTDNSLILRALAREPGRHRGVVVVDTAVTDAIAAKKVPGGVLWFESAGPKLLLEEIGVGYDLRYCDIPRMDGTGARDPGRPFLFPTGDDDCAR